MDLALKKVCFLGTRPQAPYMGIPSVGKSGGGEAAHRNNDMMHQRPTTNEQKMRGARGRADPAAPKKDGALKVPEERNSGNGSPVKVLRSKSFADVEI